MERARKKIGMIDRFKTHQSILSKTLLQERYIGVMNLLYITCYPDATTAEIESALVDTFKIHLKMYRQWYAMHTMHGLKSSIILTILGLSVWKWDRWHQRSTRPIPRCKLVFHSTLFDRWKCRIFSPIIWIKLNTKFHWRCQWMSQRIPTLFRYTWEIEINVWHKARGFAGCGYYSRKVSMQRASSPSVPRRFCEQLSPPATVV